MDKNKNRTDLLVAGRKKLQQFRRQKDGKGSKSSGKDTRPDGDVVADESSSVAKPAKGKKKLPAAKGPAHHSTAELVDSASHGSTDDLVANSADAGAPDLSSTTNVSVEVTGDGEDGSSRLVNELVDAFIPDEDLQRSNNDNEASTISSLETVNVEGKSESAHIPVMPVGLKAVLDYDPARKADELSSVCGEDQVPDVGAMQEHDHSFLEPDDRPSLIDLEGDVNQAPTRLDERSQVDSGDVQEDTKMERTSSAAGHTREHDGFPAFAGASDIPGVTKADVHSVSHILPILDGFPSSTPEPTIQKKEDVMAGFHVEESVKLPLASGDSKYRSLDGHMSSGGELTPVSLTQLAKVIQLLSEDEFRFLVSERELVTSGHLKKFAGISPLKSDSSDFSEKLKEQLYITSFEKELIYLQLCERDIQECNHHGLQWGNDTSAASLNDAERKNGYLSEELAQCRSELDRVTCEREKLQKNFSLTDTELNGYSAQINELRIQLEKSEHQLSNMSSELIDCRSLLADLQVKNEDLNVSVASLTEVKIKLEKEKGDGALENEKLAKELKDCNSLLELSQVENANSRESLAFLTEERTKLEEEKQNYVREKDKLLSELGDWKRSVEALQVENAKLNGVLTSEREERSNLQEANEYLVQENKKLSTELLEYQRLVENLRSEIAILNGSFDLVTKERNRLEEEMDHLKIEKEECLTELTNCKTSMKGMQVDYQKSLDELKEGALCIERLTEENVTLTGTLDMYKTKIIGFGELKMKSEQGTSEERISVEDNSQQVPEKGVWEISHPTSKDDQLECNVFEDSSGFVALKRRLSEVEKVTHMLDKAIEGMHSHSVLLSMSGEKSVAPGVSKLIQAFETKGCTDDEEMPLMEDSNPYMTAKEKIGNLKDLFKDLVLDVEKASELFTVERSGKILSDTKLRELMVHLETLKEQSNNLEETFTRHVVLDEVLKQYVCIVEAKKSELMVLYEDLRQEENVTKATNHELTGKLCTLESRVNELQEQVDELQGQSDNMDSLNDQLETVHRKLDACIWTISDTLSSETGTGQNIGTRVATSVDAAIAVIQDLQGKLEGAQRNHNLLWDSYKDITGKTKDLEGKSELAADVLHKIYDNLLKLVKDSRLSNEESKEDIRSEKLLNPLHISNYDVLMEQLKMLIGERGQLESTNRELLGKIKDREELNKRYINPDHVVNLLGDIENLVQLEDIEIRLAEPMSSLESIIHFLIKRARSAEEQVSLFREKAKSDKTESLELHNQIDHLCSSILPYENESHIFKESLRSALEQLFTLQSETQQKETELQQSEQRVSALREKLHIAVTKGKGLISQRDNLKQSLTATASELEKCLHELQLKDAKLQEVEMKLKTYSEAGERMEALESELSYIRHSATALRESFLLKDSVLQRIEELVEHLELPEDFHARDIIGKVDWLARSVSGNAFPESSWNHKSSTGAGSYSDSGFGTMDGWKEDQQPASVPGGELRRNYEELQSKFYELAEQNEMLEESLMERNNLVRRWEEILDKISMPPQLRSLEPEDRIKWLQNALSEANDHCNSLQENISNLENVCGSLTADLEDSQRRVSDLEAALQSITNEREHLSASLEVQCRDYDKIFEKAALYEIENDKLQNEVGALQLKLNEKCVDEEHIQHLHGEIRRLQDLVRGEFQIPETEDLDSSTSDIQSLEGLLRKLADKYVKLPLGENVRGDAFEEHVTKERGWTHGERTEQTGSSEELDLVVLERKLEEAEGDLIRVKEEMDRHVEKNQALVRKVEALEEKNQELQKLVMQEEQKSAAVKEKLNVAVRKGKSLVQQRDSMRQSINDITSEVERLNSEVKHRENTLLEYELKMKDMIISQERMKDKDSEIQSLRNHLAEVDSELQDKRNTLNMIFGALADIDLGVELKINDPVEKLEHIQKTWRDLHAAVSSSEQDSKKSKRAAELLLAELNEVQERNEDLLEELSKVNMELSGLSKERDSAEAAKHEYLSRLEQLSALHSEEISSQLSELMVFKSDLDQLRPGFIEINNLLDYDLPKDLDLLYNLEASIKSLLGSSDASNDPSNGAPGSIVSRSENKVNVLHSELLDSETGEQFNDNNSVDLWRSVGNHLQQLKTKIGAFEEKMQSHSKYLHEEVILLSETVATIRREMTSHKYSLESANEEIAHLQFSGKKKETENLVLCRYISVLYEACKSSVLEIEKSKAEPVANDSTPEDLRYELNSSPSTEGRDIFSGQTLSSSEERMTSMVNRLLSLVKDLCSIHAESVEVSQKEMKATISSLQKELWEKDIEKDKICVELVGQIKHAEATAMSNLHELEPAKARIHDLEGQLEAANAQHDVLEQKINELQSQESILVDLRERVKSLTDALAAKEQEAEALLQALDEEEAQMEDLTNKITELEKLLLQKDLDLERAEASRGKALKKLSTTVSKFDDLHHLSETLLSEVEKLQSQLQERDSEISFLRDEITRITSDSILASKSEERQLDEVQSVLTWLGSMISGVQKHDVKLVDKKINQVHEYKQILEKQITSIISELEDLRVVARSKDDQLHIERSRVEDLIHEREVLENSLREKESQLSMHQNVGDSSQVMTTTSEIVEVEPVINKWPAQGSTAPQVRSLRKVNNEQLAISIDEMDLDSRDKLEEDDDKAHGFKSLTTSKIVPKFTRPVSDLIDGLWVSCDRALMRQPALRLGVIIYWAVMHALLAVFVV